jgi:hypothetical protein
MCPACLTTLAVIAAGSTSVGSLTALAMKKLCTTSVTENTRNQTISNVNERRTQDVNQHDHKSENRFAR